MFGYILNKIGQIFSNIDDANVEFRFFYFYLRTQTDKLNNYLLLKKIKNNQKSKVRRYFEYYYE